jgi:hypothetical protein
MSAKTDLISKDAIRSCAISKGLTRPQAWVVAIIGFWSQTKGGVEIGKGMKWQWREYAEMSAEIGYSTKSVGRAVAELKDAGIIEVKRIWHPTKPGRSLNAFRMTWKGRSLLGIPSPYEASQLGKVALFEKDKGAVSSQHLCPNQGGHDGAAKYIGQTETKTVNSATDSHASETGAEAVLEKFGKEYLHGGGWNQITKDAVYRLWLGYKWLIRDAFDKSVGSYNAKREQWLIEYLKVFREEGYSPWHSVVALAMVATQWSSFAEVLATFEGKPHFAMKEYPDPYTLGVYGHVVLEFFRDQTLLQN